MSALIRQILAVILMCFHFGTLNCHDANFSYPKSVINIKSENQISEARKYWLAADKSLKKAMAKFIRSNMQSVMREIYTKNISTDCLNGLLHFTSGLRKTKLWAFEMIDATGKLPEGFLAGTLTTLGDYQQCVDIDAKDGKLNIEGQYCSIEVHPPLPEWHPFMSMHIQPLELRNLSEPDTVITHLSVLAHNLYIVHITWGICVPSVCGKADVQNLIQIIPERTGIDWIFNVSRCETKQTLSFTYSQTVILIIFGVLAFLITCGTIVGIIWNEEEFNSGGILTTILQYIHAFSIFSNSRKLASYEGPYEHLRFLYGTMFVCVFWILVSNSFMYVNYHVASNFLEALRASQYLFFQIILNRSIPIQTFFFMSGLIISYKWMKEPVGSISIWKHVIKRYLRYTPTYLLMIALVVLVPTWGSGPSWKDYINPISDKCLNSWWGNILYVNNFIDMETSCLNHTWIFAVEAQLYLFGFIILIPLKRKPTVGLMLNFILICASLLTIALINMYNELPPGETTSFLHEGDRAYFASHTYFRIYTHFCMYCTGIFAGYIIAEKPKFNPPKWLSTIIWILTISSSLATVCIVREWKNGDLPSPALGAVYASLGKVGWVAVLFWGAICCATGNGGTLNDFLSWRPFSFLARLAFITYIIHPVIIQIALSFMKSHFYVAQFDFLYSMLAHLLASYAFAYFCYIAFEAPIISLTDIIRKKWMNGCTGFDPTKALSSNNTCNGVLTEKPMKYEEKRTPDEKFTEFRTKF